MCGRGDRFAVVAWKGRSDRHRLSALIGAVDAALCLPSTREAQLERIRDDVGYAVQPRCESSLLSVEVRQVRESPRF